LKEHIDLTFRVKKRSMQKPSRSRGQAIFIWPCTLGIRTEKNDAQLHDVKFAETADTILKSLLLGD
jgi:hypothetical protein